MDSDDRKTVTTSRKGGGPVPEVSCSPPAEYPRPPFALHRETYCLELRGSCGRVQAALWDFFFFRGKAPALLPRGVPQHYPWELGGSLELSLRYADGI